MASASSGALSHLGVTENQKRWLVAGIALNKILIPQIRPFVEQGVNTEYIKLKTSYNIHGQTTSGRLQRWRQVLKYENINGNDIHPKLAGGRFNYSLFDCRVMSHVDFARLYVQNHMAHFTAFDDQCDASAVLTLLCQLPAFSTAVQTAAGDVRIARNDWAHCVFTKWDQTSFLKRFSEMEHLVRTMGLPTAGKLLGELKDWETKGIHLCMNSPVDPALIQLVQQELKSLRDDVKNMSAEYCKEKDKVHSALQNCISVLEEMKPRMERLEICQQNTEREIEDVKGRINAIEDAMHTAEDYAPALQLHHLVLTVVKKHSLLNHQYHRNLTRRGLKLEKLSEEADTCYERACGKVAKIDRTQSHLTGPMDLQRQALNVRLQLFGETNRQRADSYYALGDAPWRNNDFTVSALQSCQHALDRRLKLLGENHPVTADYYHALGVKQWKMNDFTSALGSHRRALEIRLKLFGENHEKTADSYHELGMTQWKLNDFSSARLLHQRALEIRQKVFGKNHEETADSYCSLRVTK